MDLKMKIKHVKTNVINGIFRKRISNRDLSLYNSKEITYRESEIKKSEIQIHEFEKIKSHAAMYNRRGHW